MTNEALLTTLASDLARLSGDADARPEMIAALKDLINTVADRVAAN
mgnify:CR=1 FL=1